MRRMGDKVEAREAAIEAGTDISLSSIFKAATFDLLFL